MSPDGPAARGEFEVIAAIAGLAGTGAGLPGVRLGIGDDAAVVSVGPDEELVLTTDLLVEDRHFRLGPRGAGGFDVGWKSLAVSVSDVAAMGGRSRFAVVSAALPATLTGSFADDLARGLAACSERYGVALVGGDTSGTPGPLFVNVALAGTVARGEAVTRSGARIGDAVCVTGALGGAVGVDGGGRHLRPAPRQDAALSLVQRVMVHAMIDVSDGLSSDLGHVLDASGAAAELWADRIPVHADALALARGDGDPALSRALHDGEDFELLFTCPPDAAQELERDGLPDGEGRVAVTVIGKIVAGAAGAALLLPSREAPPAVGRTLVRGGHDHFRGA